MTITKTTLQEPQMGLTGQWSNISACRVWSPTSEICSISRWHHLSFTPVAPYPISQSYLCSSIEVPFHHFNRFSKKPSSQTDALKTKMRLTFINMPFWQTNQLMLGHPLALTTLLFPYLLINRLPRAGQGYVPHSTRWAEPCPPFRWGHIAILANFKTQTFAHKQS